MASAVSIHGRDFASATSKTGAVLGAPINIAMQGASSGSGKALWIVLAVLIVAALAGRYA